MFLKGFFFSLVLTLTSCGYTLQQSSNPVFDKKGIRTIFVAPIRNDTYKAGAENLVFNKVLRTLSARGGVRLVRDPERADAILNGTITHAEYIMASQTTANAIEPLGTGPSNIIVATLYNATLSSQFVLNKRNVSKTIVWSSNFSRAKTFQASNQLGVLGTTSAPINDSEFDRALEDLANDMAGDIHESLLAMF